MVRPNMIYLKNYTLTPMKDLSNQTNFIAYHLVYLKISVIQVFFFKKTNNFHLFLFKKKILLKQPKAIKRL